MTNPWEALAKEKLTEKVDLKRRRKLGEWVLQEASTQSVSRRQWPTKLMLADQLS